MSERRITLLIFISLLLAYAFIFPRWLDWNANARFDLSAAIVEQGTLSIDAYVHNTGDYALFNGHRYIDKAPGLSFLGVPVYFLVSQITRPEAVQQLIDFLGRRPTAALTLNRPIEQVTHEELVFAARLALTTWLTVGMLSALLGAVLYQFLGRLNYPARWRAIAVLLYGLATPAFTYSGAYYGHQVAAVLLFCAFAWLQRLRSRPARSFEWPLIGGLLGLAVISEYPAGLVAVLVGLYGIWITRRIKPVLGMFLGGLLPLILLGWYNTVVFGSPVALGYQYTADPRWSAVLSIGFLSAQIPTWESLVGLSFSPFRGLFFSAPILLLALPGLVLLRRSAFRAEWITSLAISLSFFVLISASAQWWGGWSAGPRYLIPMLPWLVWPLTATLERMARLTPRWRIGLGVITFILAAISFANTWALTVGGQYYAPDDILNPLFDYSWSKILAGDVARNWGMIAGLRGGLSLLLLALLIVGAFGAAWYLTRPKGQQPLAETIG